MIKLPLPFKKKRSEGLHCSLCGLEASYVELYDHARLDHGLWHAVMAEAYDGIVNAGIPVVAPLTHEGQVFQHEVWTTMEAANLVWSPTRK